jgi:hypothetical protein
VSQVIVGKKGGMRYVGGMFFFCRGFKKGRDRNSRAHYAGPAPICAIGNAVSTGHLGRALEKAGEAIKLLPCSPI